MNTLLTRQPIFEANDQIAGFELLCRGGDATAAGHSADQSPERVLLDALLGAGLARLTDGHTAFLSITRELLLGDALQLLDPLAVILQLDESIEPDEQVLAACKSL
ncbi:MAG: EAL domain-containing protein, partial [Longimicrobiales bacterium]